MVIELDRERFLNLILGTNILHNINLAKPMNAWSAKKKIVVSNSSGLVPAYPILGEFKY